MNVHGAHETELMSKHLSKCRFCLKNLVLIMLFYHL